MTNIALGILGILSLFILFDVVARPTIRRLGLRNVARRKNESFLVVIGSMFATALIVASFIVGDSFGASIRTIAQTTYGPVDEIVQTETPQKLAEQIEQADTESILDGILVVRQSQVAAQTTNGIIEPSLRLVELDIAEAKRFGNAPTTTGLNALPDKLGNAQIAVNQKIADQLNISQGDSIELFFGNEPQTVTVRSITPNTGMAGFAEIIADTDAITSTLSNKDDVSSQELLLSNIGDVYSGAELTAKAENLVTSADTNNTAEVFPIKKNLLEDADLEATDMTELFGTIGGFSVAAGILLLINLFVMLAAERKVELGTLRAVGITKSQLRRAFSLEGLVYGILSSILGAVTGIAVAAGVMKFAGSAFPSDGVTLRLSLTPRALLSGAAIGLTISQLTVSLTALRLVRLNPARALVDAPDPKRLFSKKTKFIFASAGILAGLALYFIFSDNPIVVLAAPVFIAVSAIIPIQFIIGKRPATLLCCGIGLAWSAAVFGIQDEVMNDPDISLFLLQGLVMVALGVMIAGSLNTMLRAGVSLFSNSYATKLGLAYPLARPVRTALLISMYALVVFTLTFMSVMSAVFKNSVPQFAAKFGGSSEILVETNPASPLTSAELQTIDGVQSAIPIERTVLGFLENAEENQQVASVINTDFATSVKPPTLSRSTQFDSDQAMWDTVAVSDEWIVLPSFDDSTDSDTIEITMANEKTRTVNVAGVIENTWMIGSGAHLSSELAEQLEQYETLPARFYVNVEDNADPKTVSKAIESTFTTKGTQANSFLSMAEEDTAGQDIFLNILKGYLGLGLIIGIAGLGVVLIRAVRDRRRQLGMMKTVGVTSSVTRNSFLIEAGFIGVQGVALGVGLGLLSAWQIFTQSTAFEEGLSFAIPTKQLLILGIVTLTASICAGLIPAIRAARTTPAEALRTT